MADAKKAQAQLKSSSGVDRLDSTRPDLDRAYKTLTGKLGDYDNLWDYYDGDQPLMYTARRMADLFADLDMANFVENWCSVVIDAANDRIHLSSVSVENKSDNDLLENTWQTLDVGLEASDVHEAALVVGEAFMMVWPDENENVEIFYNDPRLVHLFYDPANPRKKWYGAKWWVAGDNTMRMNLYYPDRIEYYGTKTKAKNVTSSKAFVEHFQTDKEDSNIAENPYDEIPIFHFRSERRKIKGDLVNVIPLQNAINKLVTDMMVAAEYGAFKQRWIISNADTVALENAPNMIWEIPAGDGQGQSSQVGEFDATPLDNYIKAIDHMATTLAIISRTPKHYLFQQGGTPSGEALIAMESPLNKRCSDHIDQFVPVWKELVTFVMKVLGKDVEKDDIVITFDSPESIQPKTEAEIRTASVGAGIPLKTQLRDEGKSEAWMDQMDKDKEEADKASSENLGVALLAAIKAANAPDMAPEDEE